MNLDLSRPLSWKTANPDQQDMLRDLQGNILKGHGREHVRLLFLSFEPSDPLKIRAWIRNLSKEINDAHSQLRKAERFKSLAVVARRMARQNPDPFASFLLSAGGYRALGFEKKHLPPDPAFLQGMKPRAEALADPPLHAWEPHLRTDLDALLLIADHQAAFVVARRNKLVQSFPPSVRLCGEEVGYVLRDERGRGIEHFGYVDGRSQPLVLAEDIAAEQAAQDEALRWDPGCGLNIALVKDPNGCNSTCFGSYLVFRKLEQNVRGFKEREMALAHQLGLSKEDAERAGALVVGRFEDGTPIVTNERAEDLFEVSNNFDYADDPRGQRCPLHSHIRKLNPRTQADEERRHLLIRRGIPYGARPQQTKAHEPSLSDYPTGGVGLLFMAYQSDIIRQFEYAQKNLANHPDASQAATGLDPLIGQGTATNQNWPMFWGEAHHTPFDFHGFVTCKGGEYFFAPSISFLQSL